MAVIINGSSGITSVNGSAAAPSVTGTDTDTGIVYGTNTITLSTNGTAGLIQDANQNVGLNTAPTASWASSWKVLQNQGGFIGANGTSVQLVASNAYSDGTNWRYAAAGYSTSYTQFNGAHSWNSAPSGSAAGVITYTGVLAVEKDKSLALQGATSQTGTGITFPATQSASTNANTLDDYEEGTFTATVNHSGGGSFTASGVYTKIGRLVNIAITVSYDAGAGTTNYLASITGLPFTNASPQNTAVTNGLFYVMNSTGTNNISTGGFSVAAGSSNINLYLGQWGTTEAYPKFGSVNAYFQVNATYIA